MNARSFAALRYYAISVAGWVFAATCLAILLSLLVNRDLQRQLADLRVQSENLMQQWRNGERYAVDFENLLRQLQFEPATHLEWSDAVDRWLAKPAFANSGYRWSVPVPLVIDSGSDRSADSHNKNTLSLTQYPLWVEVQLEHEDALLQLLESTASLRAAAIENRGCSIERLPSNQTLGLRCLFTLLAMTSSHPAMDTAVTARSQADVL